MFAPGFVFGNDGAFKRRTPQVADLKLPHLRQQGGRAGRSCLVAAPEHKLAHLRQQGGRDPEATREVGSRRPLAVQLANRNLQNHRRHRTPLPTGAETEEEVGQEAAEEEPTAATDLKTTRATMPRKKRATRVVEPMDLATLILTTKRIPNRTLQKDMLAKGRKRFKLSTSQSPKPIDTEHGGTTYVLR